MKKNEARLHRAIHTFEMTKEANEGGRGVQSATPSWDADAAEKDQGYTDKIHHRTQGPINGLRQAAALLGGN